jgi:hypothetical protein
MSDKQPQPEKTPQPEKKPDVNKPPQGGQGGGHKH